MYTDKEGAYFGIPTANLPELGAAIAEDPRFIDCAVRTAWEGLTQRDYTDADWSEFQRHREAFEASELSIRHLTRSIVMSDEYRVKNVEDNELAERLSGVKVVNPYQLSNIIEDITGYSWTINGVNILTNQGLGVPVLLGGLDGNNVSKRNYNPSVGLAFVQEPWQTAVACHNMTISGQRRKPSCFTMSPTKTPTTIQRHSKPNRFLYRATGNHSQRWNRSPRAMQLWDQLHSIKPLNMGPYLYPVLQIPSIIVYNAIQGKEKTMYSSDEVYLHQPDGSIGRMGASQRRGVQGKKKSSLLERLVTTMWSTLPLYGSMTHTNRRSLTRTSQCQPIFSVGAEEQP